MQRLRSEFMWRCSQWRSAVAPAAADAACDRGARTSARRASTPPAARARSRSVCARRRAARGRRRADRAVGERREGDAARGLSAASRTCAAPKAARGRARAARPDDPPLGQRRGLTGVQHRRHGRARAAGAPRRTCSRFHATRPWGLSTIDVADQTRFFLHIDRRVPRRHRRYAMRLLGSIVPSQRWGIAAPARAAGRSTSRAAGAPARAGPTTRWPCCAAGGAGSRWRS